MRPCPEEIRTERLILRRWREADYEPYAVLQGNPAVRRHYPGLMSPEESAADAEHLAGGCERDGYGFWVVERPGEASFIGIAGLRRIPRDMPFRPLVDVGWLFMPQYWGRGYATEAAGAALADAFARTDLDEVVAYTSHRNIPSQRVMQRLGMVQDTEFEHPNVPVAHPLQPYVLYRTTRATVLSHGRPEGLELGA